MNPAAFRKGSSDDRNPSARHRDGSRWANLSAALKMETAGSVRTRRSLPPGGMQALQESMKEKQTKAKEHRERRQKLLGIEQRYIFSLVSLLQC